MNIRRQLRHVDWVLFGSTLALICIGLLFIVSASSGQPVNGDPLFWFKRQAVWAVLSVAAMIAAMLVDYSLILRLAPWIYGANLGLLTLVLVVGRTTMGAQRWLHIGGVTIQPSEFAKVAMIVAFASFLANTERAGGSAGRDEPRPGRELIPSLLYVALPWLLVFRQPDLGTSLVFGAIFLGMLYAAGISPKLLFGLIGGVIGGSALAIYLHYRFGLPIPLRDYQLRRIMTFVNPGEDLRASGYHTRQSQIAIGSGRLLGKGFLKGSQNQLNFLPTRHTDFIFSVVGEEVGFIGAVLVLLLFAVILWRCIQVAARAQDTGGSLLAVGVACMIAFHVFVNVGMAAGVMPVTGLPLPFLSQGGSSLLTNCIAIGLVLNVNMRRFKIYF